MLPGRVLPGLAPLSGPSPLHRPQGERRTAIFRLGAYTMVKQPCERPGLPGLPVQQNHRPGRAIRVVLTGHSNRQDASTAGCLLKACVMGRDATGEGWRP